MFMVKVMVMSEIKVLMFLGHGHDYFKGHGHIVKNIYNDKEANDDKFGLFFHSMTCGFCVSCKYQ